MLFNIHTGEWDEELLKLFGVPRSVLPEVALFERGVRASVICSARAIPIAGIAGDQQAALFGQVCTKPGMVKNTYGTGCFMLMHTGAKPIASKNNLLTTVAWRIGGKTEYALEGSIFIAGAVVQWLRDGLGIIASSSEVEALAARVPDNGRRLSLCPPSPGLGAPHWDQYARGLIIGLTRGTNRAHIARAALEGIAYQVADVLRAMERDAKIRLKELRVDGGASANNLLMQFQADLARRPRRAAAGVGDDGARRRLSRGTRRRLLEKHGRDRGPVADRSPVLAVDEIGRSRRAHGRLEPRACPRAELVGGISGRLQPPRRRPLNQPHRLDAAPPGGHQYVTRTR